MSVLKTDGLVATVRLLPCPFCGGPPCPFVGLRTGGAIPNDTYWDHGVWCEAFVFCHECGAQSESVEALCFNDDEPERSLPKAVELWQDRSLRNLALYLAGYADGHSLFPRPDQPASSAVATTKSVA